MKLALSIFCFIFAAIAFLDGFITEYKQSRKVGSAAVPTLPMAVVAAFLVMLGLLHLPYHVPLWILPLAFVGSTVIFGYAISNAHK
jgi:heme A synthase